MEFFEGLIGNEDIKSTLGNAIAKREFLHAYIIEGAPGTGKRTVARLASAGIICTDPQCTWENMCDMCKKILNDNCTDVRFFDAYKVDDVRKIKETLYESPTECDYKIYILNNAEKIQQLIYAIKSQHQLTYIKQQKKSMKLVCPPHYSIELINLCISNGGHIIQDII